jgi:hypothetical protein
LSVNRDATSKCCCPSYINARGGGGEFGIALSLYSVTAPPSMTAASIFCRNCGIVQVGYAAIRLQLRNGPAPEVSAIIGYLSRMVNLQITAITKDGLGIIGHCNAASMHSSSRGGQDACH